MRPDSRPHQTRSPALGTSLPRPSRTATPAAPDYDSTAKSLHWLIVALVLTQFIVSWLMPGIGRNTVPGTLINLHFSLGVLILVVMAVRFAHRLLHPTPPAMPDAPAWERRLAQAIHGLFYAILLIVPFLGWASAHKSFQA